MHPNPPTPFDQPRSLAYNLRELILANNTPLVGRFPDEAAGLAHLHRVGLVGTNMSCVPQDVAEAAEAERAAGRNPGVFKCPEKGLLPCFLDFESYTIPLSDNSRMSCRPIRRRAMDEVMATCPPAALLSAPDKAEEVLAAQWDLPPAYYQYQGCACLEGWLPVWSLNGTRLECVQDSRVSLPAWTWVLVALGAALVLLAGSLLLLSSRLLLFRSRWLREAELKRKRRLGLPKEGDNVCVVVTDIEGYSCEHGRPGAAVSCLQRRRGFAKPLRRGSGRAWTGRVRQPQRLSNRAARGCIFLLRSSAQCGLPPRRPAARLACGCGSSASPSAL